MHVAGCDSIIGVCGRWDIVITESWHIEQRLRTNFKPTLIKNLSYLHCPLNEIQVIGCCFVFPIRC